MLMPHASAADAHAFPGLLGGLASAELGHLARLMVLHDDVLDPVGRHAKFYGKACAPPPGRGF
jgi:hypothetical protein